MITNWTQIEQMRIALLDAQLVAFDVETTGLDVASDELIGIAFATEDADWYVDFIVLEEHGINPLEVMIELGPVFDLTKRILVAHNTIFDYTMLRRYYEQRGQSNPFIGTSNLWDTMAMAALDNENLIHVRIEFDDEETDGIKKRQVGCLSLKAQSRLVLGREQRLYYENFMEWTAEERDSYARADARNCYDLAIRLRRTLDTKRLWEYYTSLIAPLVFVCHSMETYGVPVDADKLKEFQVIIQGRIADTTTELQTIVPPAKEIKFAAPSGIQRAQLIKYMQEQGWDIPQTTTGKPSVSAPSLAELYEWHSTDPELLKYSTVEEIPFNPNSTVQLGNELLRRGYSPPKTPTGKPSVSEDTLDDLADSNPEDIIWEPLLRLRHLTKLQGTYVTGVLDVIWEDGRCHPQWNYIGTVTGRFTSTTAKRLEHKRGPAFQTIPRPDTVEDQGWDINPREVYVAPPGHKMVVADLSQAEVRMLAVMSGDANLIDAIQSGEDLHTSIASRIFGEEWDAADAAHRKILRYAAKTAVFASIYGVGPTTLAKNLRRYSGEGTWMDWHERASKLLRDFYQAFPGVDDWKRDIWRQVQRYGYVKTFMGRRRTPIVIQPAPRVMAKKGTKEYERETLNFHLWKTLWLAGVYKSHYDPETVTRQELEARASRQAVNSVIQGSVAEFMNWGMIKLFREGWQVVAQVHDEVLIIVEDDEEILEEVRQDIQQTWNVSLAVKDDPTTLVPFTVDIGVGDSWAAKK